MTREPGATLDASATPALRPDGERFRRVCGEHGCAVDAAPARQGEALECKRGHRVRWWVVVDTWTGAVVATADLAGPRWLGVGSAA